MGLPLSFPNHLTNNLTFKAAASSKKAAAAHRSRRGLQLKMLGHKNAGAPLQKHKHEKLRSHRQRRKLLPNTKRALVTTPFMTTPRVSFVVGCWVGAGLFSHKFQFVLPSLLGGLMW